jgi:hypothetical protein
VTIPGASLVVAVGAAQFNNDGYPDLVINNAAVLEVHYGQAGGPSTAGPSIATPAQWVAGAFTGSFGDVNGDGYDDLTVGVRTPDATGYDRSSAVLHLGGPTGLEPAGTPAM